MKKEIYDKCVNANFIDIFNKKGYTYYNNKSYDLNIIGIRDSENNECTNRFDEAIVVEYRTKTGVLTRKIFAATTRPGSYYMRNPNAKGTAILVPGQYKSVYSVDLHKGKYQALCQKGTMSVYRDNNKDQIFDMNPNKIDKGIFGINIHRASAYAESTLVDNWSAGCQVIANPNDFKIFMSLAKRQIKEGLGNKFTYTLLESKDL